MKRIIVFLGVLFFFSFVVADTTFFDQDNFFIMGVTTTTEDITGEMIGVGGCRYEWECTNWGICLSDGKQIRECNNLGTCSDTYRAPEIKRNCIYIDSSENIEEDETKNESEIESGGTTKITGKVIGENISSENKIFIYFIIALIIISIIFYLKRNYFKKLINKIKFNYFVYKNN
jgi:hypothetical protein